MPESAAAHALLVKVQADVADIDKVINGLGKITAATKASAGASAASIGFFTEAFGQLGDAAKKTSEILVNFLEGFVERAAKIQEEEFPLTQILRDNGVVAKEVLEGISSLWQQVGVISSESLSRAARSLLLMNVHADNLISRLQDLSKIAVGTGEAVDQVAGAYQRVRQAIEKETAPAVRGVGAFGLSTLAIFQALEDHFGRLAGQARLSEGQIVAMFQGGKISIDDLNKSLAEAAAEGGRFGDVIEQKKATFNGAIEAMQTAWQGFQVEIGKPIIDFLTPIINRITVFEQRLIEVAKSEGWSDALKAAWTVVMEELLLIADKILIPGMQKVGEHMAETLGLGFAKFLSVHFPDISGAIVKMLIPDIPADVSGRQANQYMKDFLKAMETPDTSARDKAAAKFREVLKGLIPTGDWVTDEADKFWMEFLAHPPPMPVMPEQPEETHRADTAKELSAALHELELVMNNIRAENTLISASPFLGMDEKQVALITNTEKQLENLQAELVKLKALQDVLPLNDPQMAQLKVKIATAENEFRKLGQSLVGMTQPINAEMQKWANSFGSTAHQIASTIQGTINASLQSLNQFLVTGKFNAQALLQQIILLGLQLIEQLAIQQVMRIINHNAAIAEAEVAGPVIAAALAPAVTAQTIASDGGAAIAAPFQVAAAEAGILGILSAHAGGLMRRYFHGGGLAHDEVPIIAQEGEIMIQRSVAQQPGMADFLLGLNAGSFHQGGFVFGGRYHDGGGGEREVIHFPGGNVLPSHWATDPGGLRETFGQREAMFLQSMWSGFGYTGPAGSPWSMQGPTMIPTTMGSSGFPMAVSLGPTSDIPLTGTHIHTPPKQTSHRGGVISRMHGGGSVAGSGGGIHIYAFTDLRQLTKHMASKEGQKIIFDTVKGRRIDLGIS
jgi:hypothetical protein